MDKVSKEIKPVSVSGEFRICPACGYERGFHLSYVPQLGDEKLHPIFICPDCGARYRLKNPCH